MPRDAVDCAAVSRSPGPEPRKESPVRLVRLLPCLLLLAAPMAGADATKPEQHVSKATLPPAPGAPLAALPAYGTRLGVGPRTETERQFDKLVDEFLRSYFASQPVRATNA